MMTQKEAQYYAGVSHARYFCEVNSIVPPEFRRIKKGEREYELGSCAYYRPTTINVMVEKCATNGRGGPAWSWPGYVVDRTPYGVVQHELGHHLDHVRTSQTDGHLFSRDIYTVSGEPQLTGYLGTDTNPITFFKEWFAECFRLFITNPDLVAKLRPKFYAAMLFSGFKPIIADDWELTLELNGAPARITEMARKKIVNG